MIRRAVPYIPQMEMAECGLACLAMILASHGRHRSLLDLRARSGVGRDGLSAAQIVKLAAHEGLAGTGARVAIARLKKNDLFPAILHWRLDHFVVAVRARRGGLLIVDPAVGRRTVPWSEVDREFSGVCLMFTPTDAFARLAPRRSAAHAWWPLLRGMAPLLLGVIALGFAFDALSFAFPAALSAFGDFALPARSRGLLAVLVAVVATMAVVRAVFVAARTRILEGARVELERRFGGELFAHLLGLEVPFFVKRSAGDLAARAQAVLGLRETVLALFQGGFDLLLLVAYFGFLFAYDASLAALLGGLVVARMALSLAVTRSLGDQAVSEAVARAEVADVFVAAFRHLESVKALHLEPYFLAKLDRARHREIGSVAAAQGTADRSTALVTLLERITLAALLLVGGRRVIDGALTLGALTTFLAVDALVAGRTASMADLALQLARVGPTLDRLDDILTATPAPAGGTALATTATLEARQVTFAFDASIAPTLTAIDVRIAAGEHVALVGRSGSGKSTLLRLLTGMLEPVEGEILVDGQPLAWLDLPALRRETGFVPAGPQIFDGTVRHNVALQIEVDDEDVTRALRAARLDEVVGERSLGIHAPLSHERTHLSAGQEQRLVLARALVKSPRLLLLDEATSALDLRLEAEILDELRQTGATIVSATHRAAVMRAADRILVLERGRIVDQGTFDELSARSPAFREVVA